MSQADRPYLTRRLAGVEQALGEGGARQPVELLDQLRERLDRLDPAHPSANSRSADLDEAQGRDVAADQDLAPDAPAGEAAETAQAAQDRDPDRSSTRKEGADSSPGDQAGDRVGAPGASAAADGVAAGAADDGHYRVVEADPVAKGEPYRPWFAGDPDAPWFTDPWFVE